MTELPDLDTFSGRGIKDYLDIPKRRPWHIVLPCVALGLVGFGASFLVKNLYRTSTTILVESEKVPDSIVRRSGDDDPTKPRMLTIRQELLSRTRLEKLLKELDPYPDLTGHQPLTNVIETLRKATEIGVKGEEAFTVQFVHTDPNKAMQVANRLASLFIEESARSREEQVEGASDFLESQLADARKQLEEKEREVRRFKELHMGRLPEQTTVNLATLERFQMERQNVESQLAAARQREVLIEKGSGDIVTTTPSGAVVVNEPARELAKAREELAVLRTRYTDEHPDVRAQLARVGRLEREAGDAENRPVTTTTSTPNVAARAQLEQVRGEIRALEARKADVERQMGVFQGRVEEAPRAEQELLTLTRDVQKLNDNYTQLLTKRLDAQMRERLEKRWKGERFRVLDPAYVPEAPYFPSRSLFASVGAILGLILGTGLAFATEFMDPSIKSEAELAEMIPHPVLVTFPRIPSMMTDQRGGGGASGPGRGNVHELREWRDRGQAARG